VGRQHALDTEYFDRIEALNYALAHDDGQGFNDLEGADVVLVGVSRTSKTPTSIYLAHRGVRTANVPLVPGSSPRRSCSRSRSPWWWGSPSRPTV
jgi:regulator of PEP synthase PpsR (kinase-PPPase family)